jgi:hypothetical protein
MKLFNKKRKRDINLELGISKNNSLLDFYVFADNQSVYNTFSKSQAYANINKGIKLLKKHKFQH